ncbi:MAG: hypothetical protein PHI47_09680 [Sulfuricurvum sp.]|uniref:hypothetical protein n=1 Tax=Sulfuricurvum sp. TaxID=2025608 RepID=UPI002638DE95|nr:hypothetical protein [Sulfuricurvum sp.]MDD5158625.1 hypothetical protein [Sulfuricurvum sp.]MDD5160309.1 hypothetical protein [Sulfuricurvum sp.]
MDENLKNEVIEIIQKQSNCSKLNFDINIFDQVPLNAHQFPTIDSTFKKIDIICSNTNFDSFISINDEIKNIYSEIEKINSTYFVSFIFDKCHIKFWNENVNLDWHILFNECKLNVYIENSKIYHIHLLARNFQNCEFEQISLLNDITIIHIDLNLTSIKMLQLVKTEILDNEINKIELNNCEINEMTIIDSTFKRDFTIYKTKINIIAIKNVDFEVLSEFNEVTFQEEFDLSEITYKGFALFDKCIFNTKAKFEYIIFEKFVSFRGSIFNKGLNLDYTSGDKEINFFGINGLESKESRKNTSRETYRIIKYNFEKIGNKIEANYYHTLELARYRNDIWKHSLLDGIVSFFHWLSSNYSTNWFLSLFWIFIISICTNLSLGNDLIILNKIQFECIFKYINILSSINDFNNSYIIMVLNKVSLGYLYYQFLTAVRKDTRK